MASLFAYMPFPKGKKVGIVGLGGGASVLSADDCVKAGLFLPPLSEEIKERLRRFTTTAGNILGNPVDTQSFSIGPKAFSETLRIVGSSEQVDILLLHIAYDELPGVPRLPGVPQLPDVLQMGALSLFRFELQTWIEVVKEIGKPAVAVLHYTTLPRSFQAMCEDREICGKAGLPVFYSMSGAVNAISKFLQYHENRVRND